MVAVFHYRAESFNVKFSYSISHSIIFSLLILSALDTCNSMNISIYDIYYRYPSARKKVKQAQTIVVDRSENLS